MLGVKNLTQQSKIVNIEIQNFMSIGYAKLSFDESGILNLVGYNDSGKSAVTRALEVILYDAYSNIQNKFIKDNTAHFGIGIEFDDGVAINRYKYRNGKSVWEMEKDGVTLYTNDLGGNIASTDGVPVEISRYLGVAIEPQTKNKLNVRRNTDKLFLIETSGSENYKIINNFLRYDILSNATNKLNADRNKMQSDYGVKNTRRDTLRSEANAITVAPEWVFDDLKESTEMLNDKKNQLSYLTSLAEKAGILAQCQVYDEIETVEMERMLELQNLALALQKTDVDVYEELPDVNTERLNMLLGMASSAQNLAIDAFPELPVVDNTRLTDLIGLGNSYTALYEKSVELMNTETAYTDVKTQLETLSKQYGFKICDGCGAVVA